MVCYSRKASSCFRKNCSITRAIFTSTIAPNHKAILEQFHNYDWQAIDAEIETTDSCGVAMVIWQGERYKRRSPNNAYGAVIFFSRCVGKSDDGSNQYERLITFEPLASIQVEPISNKANNIIQ